MNDLLLPAYGRASLADLLPAIGFQLGVSGGVELLDLPPARRYVVLLIDGLGWEQRGYWDSHAPFLARSGAAGRWMTSGAPATTATSLTSLGTGLAPGSHGIAGYSFRYPQTRTVINSLAWPADVHALDVQPQPTWFERLTSAGVQTAMVAPARFDGSGLTLAALRGPRFLGVRDETDQELRVALSVDAAQQGDRSFVYTYERALDHAGHAHGVGSQPWLTELARCDRLARMLAEQLPSDAALVITGDHGMVNVPATNRLIVEDEPALLHQVDAFAGEGRLRQLYVRAEAIEQVKTRWQERLGERAWVLTRDQAFADGWFGPFNPRVADRFGDVLVAMRDDGAVMSRTLPGEFTLVGMHASLTAAEVAVPLLVVSGG